MCLEEKSNGPKAALDLAGTLWIVLYETLEESRSQKELLIRKVRDSVRHEGGSLDLG